MAEKILVKDKLVCVALNDREQLARLSDTFNQPPYNTPPTEPVLYYKPRNTWSSEGAEIPWAADKDQHPVLSMVVGASLGAVIGNRTCRVSPDESLKYLSGFTIVHDFSLPETSYYRPDILGKCQDGSAPVGPHIVPARQFSDLSTLQITTAVNGETKSVFRLESLYRGVAELISLISKIMTLQTGEIIAVGFPGERVPVNQGDQVVSQIEGIGELSNRVGGVW